VDLPLLNMMIPEFLLEFMFLSFIGVSFVEGIFLNIARRGHLLNWKGLLAAVCLNAFSTILGAIVALGSTKGYDWAVLMAFFGSVIFEALLLVFYRMATYNSKVILRQLLFLLIGNIITYIILWFTGPLMF